MMSIQEIQDAQYSFPYHYIPYIENNGKGEKIVSHRYLDWSHEYYCYMTHLAKKINESNAKSILDIGCGEGVLLSLINTNIKKTGADTNRNAILWANAICQDATFFCGDFKLINEQFDIVTLVETLEHIPDDYVAEFLKNALNKLNVMGGANVHTGSDSCKTG